MAGSTSRACRSERVLRISVAWRAAAVTAGKPRIAQLHATDLRRLQGRFRSGGDLLAFVLGDGRQDVDQQGVACGLSQATNSMPASIRLETKATLRARRSSLAMMRVARRARQAAMAAAISGRSLRLPLSIS
jgi:hypothetical protein